MSKNVYRNIYAEVDIIATGDKKYPTYYCENAIVNSIPNTYDTRHDLVVTGKLYTNDLVYGVKYNHRSLTKIFEQL